MANALDSGWAGLALGFGAATGILLLRTVGNTVVYWISGTTVTAWAEGVSQ